MQTRFVFSIVLAACFAVACAQEKTRSDTTTIGTAQPTPSARPAAWLITPRGLGPLTAGMSRADAEAIVGGSLVAAGDSAWSGCAYVSSDRLPAGVRVMVEGGRIARIDVDSGGIATVEGARIGDSEDRIGRLYPGRVVITPHKYTNGHYLTIKPAVDADTLFRIVFETDSGRVTSYRAGRIPQVEYLERCG